MRRRDLAKAIALSAGPVLLARQASAQTCTAPCYATTQAETNAGVTPTNFAYMPGDVRRYGVTGSGIETTKLQQALSVQQDVFIPGAMTVHTASAVTLLSNQTLYGTGPGAAISCAGSSTNAVEMSGVTYAGVRDLFIKYSGPASSGTNGAAVVIRSGSSFCTVTRCRLEGVQGGATINLSDDNVIDDNTISSIALQGSNDQSWDVAIYLGGSKNRVTRNKCYGGGGTGVLVESDTTTSCDHNIIADNHVSDHTQYGIIVYNGGGSCYRNTIANNQIWNISGIVLSSGNKPFGAGIYIQSAEWSTVVGNILENTNINTNVKTLAPGAIGINSTSCFAVMGNIIKAPNWFGIHSVLDGNGLGGGVVEGNLITAPVKTGILLENRSQVAVIGNTITGGQGDGIDCSFNAGTGIGISIQSNKIRNCTAGTGINVQNSQCPNISGNYISACLNGLQVTTTVGGIICGNEVRNSTSNDVFLDNSNSGFIHFDRNVVRSAANNGVNDNAGMIYGDNDVAGQTTPFAQITLERALTGSAPSVRGSRMASYGGSSAITDLLDPFPGQRITIRATSSITLNHGAGAPSTRLLMRSGTNLSLTANQTATFEYVPGGPWFQVA